MAVCCVLCVCEKSEAFTEFGAVFEALSSAGTVDLPVERSSSGEAFFFRLRVLKKGKTVRQLFCWVIV